MVDPAWKDELARRPTTSLEPAEKTCANVGGQFKLHWPACLLLHDDRPSSDIWPRHQIANGNLHEITPS